MAEKIFDGFDHTQYRDEVEGRWGKDACAGGGSDVTAYLTGPGGMCVADPRFTATYGGIAGHRSSGPPFGSRRRSSAKPSAARTKLVR